MEVGIEIALKKPEDFLVIEETLTRIGIANRTTKTLFQSCHILHRKNKYYIVHFKEMFLLDGKNANITEEDISRRNTIANMLSNWNLLTIKNPMQLQVFCPLSHVKILAHKEKVNWHLVMKYNLGIKRDNAIGREHV